MFGIETYNLLQHVALGVTHLNNKVDAIAKVMASGGSGDPKAIQALIDQLAASNDALRKALTLSGSDQAAPSGPRTTALTKEKTMNPTLDALAVQVKANTDAEASAVIALNGVSGRIQDAVNKAIAGGATAEDLAPVQAEVDALKASADALSAAIVANTPAAAPAP